MSCEAVECKGLRHPRALLRRKPVFLKHAADFCFLLFRNLLYLAILARFFLLVAWAAGCEPAPGVAAGGGGGAGPGASAASGHSAQSGSSAQSGASTPAILPPALQDPEAAPGAGTRRPLAP